MIGNLDAPAMPCNSRAWNLPLAASSKTCRARSRAWVACWAEESAERVSCSIVAVNSLTATTCWCAVFCCRSAVSDIFRAVLATAVTVCRNHEVDLVGRAIGDDAIAGEQVLLVWGVVNP